MMHKLCNMLSIKEGLTPVYSIYGSTIPSTWGSSDGYLPSVVINTSANGYRLPTEMENMWAMMGGLSDSVPGDIVGGVNTGGYTKAFAGSNGTNSINDYVWYGWSGGGDANNTMSTLPVGSLTPNELGIYDLSGNLDCWDFDLFGNVNVSNISARWPAGTLTNYCCTSSSTINRCSRGGDWISSASRCDIEGYGPGDGTLPNSTPGMTSLWMVGFRVVRSSGS